MIYIHAIFKITKHKSQVFNVRLEFYAARLDGSVLVVIYIIYGCTSNDCNLLRPRKNSTWIYSSYYDVYVQ